MTGGLVCRSFAAAVAGPTNRKAFADRLIRYQAGPTSNNQKAMRRLEVPAFGPDLSVAVRAVSSRGARTPERKQFVEQSPICEVVAGHWVHPAKSDVGIRAVGADEIWHRSARTNCHAC